MKTSHILLCVMLSSAPAAAQAPGQHSFDHPYRVRPASDGRYLLHPDDLQPAAGDRLAGIVSLQGTQNALDRYADLPGAAGAIYRTDIRMHDEPDPAYLAERIRTGRQAGMQVWLTFVGTPLDLSTAPWDVEPVEYGIIGFAKAPPTDLALWAHRVRDLLLDCATLYGEQPDYVEIWNEPDLDLWWTGSRQQLLDLYAETAVAVRSAFPDGSVKVGGLGLGRMQAEMDGDGLVLEELLRRAAAEDLPLDFLSFHHYQLARGMLFYDTIPHLQRVMQDAGKEVDLVVSECGLYGRTAENPRAEELEGSPAAAQYVGILASGLAAGVRTCLYFCTQDATAWDPQISDLLAGLGVLSRRGVKKPVFRAMEMLVPMSQEARVRVDAPDREWAMTAFATRSGNRVRLLLANDTCEPQWIWTEACKERGAAPRRLWDALQLVTGRPTVAALMEQGLEAWEAEVALQVLPIALEAQERYDLPRDIQVQVDHPAGFAVTRVVRFCPGQNDPASRREEFLATLEWVDQQADLTAAQAASQIVVQAGFPEPPPTTVWAGREPADLAAELGIPERVAELALTTYERELHENRLAHMDMVNNLPAALVHEETAAEAGVTVAGDTLHVPVPTNSLVVLDLELR